MQAEANRMHTWDPLVLFTCAGQPFALPLAVVERVVRAVTITPVPDAPERVLGVINAQGRLIAVVDIRQPWGPPKRNLELSDRLIIAHTSRRQVALVADSVEGVVVPSEHHIVAAETMLPGLDSVLSVLKRDDGTLLLIHNLDALLSIEDVKKRNDASQQ